MNLVHLVMSLVRESSRMMRRCQRDTEYSLRALPLEKLRTLLFSLTIYEVLLTYNLKA